MTPTADLMKLVEAVEAARSYIGSERPDPEEDPEDAELWDNLTKAAAALTASCDARVGGEVEFVADICGPCGRVFDAPHDCPLATPAQPKASEGKAGGEDARAKYEELLYAVAWKFPGESRHETALRYIRQAESQDHGPAQSAKQGEINGAA